jgi:hypothetical protein
MDPGFNNDLDAMANDLDAMANQINQKISSKNLDKNATRLNKMRAHVNRLLFSIDNLCHIYQNKRIKHGCLKISDQQHNSYLFSDHQAIAPGISIKTKVVETMADVPNINICWVADINQFAFRLNGVMFRGNIGNIYNKRDIQTHKKIHQTIPCNHDNACKGLLDGSGCIFYHDPVNVNKLYDKGVITVAQRDSFHARQRNFMNSSWIHTESSLSSKNRQMRHFGSRNTLKYNFDIIYINGNHDGVETFRHQCMHDVLVSLGMAQYGLIDRS